MHLRASVSQGCCQLKGHSTAAFLEDVNPVCGGKAVCADTHTHWIPQRPWLAQCSESSRTLMHGKDS